MNRAQPPAPSQIKIIRIHPAHNKYQQLQLTRPEHYLQLWQDEIQKADWAEPDKETIVTVHLDKNYHLLGYNLAHIGTADQCDLHPRDIFKAAILNNAQQIVVLHNHPNGDPTPSKEDQERTIELSIAGHYLGIPLLRHIIIGHNGQMRNLAMNHRQLRKYLSRP